MYYGIYRNIRDSAWKCLVEFHIDRLPIDVLSIAKSANINVTRNTLAHTLVNGELGKTLTDGKNWIIVYDDTQPVDVCRFTIAHELGHIFLGHNLAYAKYSHLKQFEKKPKSEQQADAFALRLLCPACVLWSLNISTAEYISVCCKIPYSLAEQRAKRMRELYKRNKFLTTPLEKEVYKQFEKSIKQSTITPTKVTS